MTTTAIRPPLPSPPDTGPPSLKAKGFHLADRSFRLLTLACGALVLAVLALIAILTTNKAFPAFRAAGLKFLTSTDWSPTAAHPRFGGLAFIYGTLGSSLIALALAVPVSLGLALFLTEVAPRRLRLPVIYLIDLLAAIPSVVFGLWGILALQKPLGHFYGHLSNLFAGVPGLDRVFKGAAGRSFFTAGLIIAMMITPIITSLAREVIETTAQSDKEAAYALGATRWEMIGAAVIPHSKGGIVGAVMLGLGRAMGETIAAALVIGSSAQITLDPFKSGDSMPAVIANQWGEASDLQKSALIGLAVTLFVMTIIVNLIASRIVQRSMKKSRGS